MLSKTLGVALPLISLLLSSQSAAAQEAPFIVDVGLSGLAFSPSTLSVDTGDQITFQFHGEHSLTQSSFAAPCSPLTDATGKEVGLDSGLMTPAAGAIASYTVNVTNDAEPLWFYCRVGPHCTLGMVFALNAPTTNQTFDAFVAAAKAATVAQPTFSSQATGSNIFAESTTAGAPGSSSAASSSSSVAAQTTTAAPTTTSAAAAGSSTGAVTTTAPKTATGVASSSSSAAAAATTSKPGSASTLSLSFGLLGAVGVGAIALL